MHPSVNLNFPSPAPLKPLVPRANETALTTQHPSINSHANGAASADPHSERHENAQSSLNVMSPFETGALKQEEIAHIFTELETCQNAERKKVLLGLLGLSVHSW